MCLYLRRKMERALKILRYLFVCLIFILINEADTFCFHESDYDENIVSTIANTETNISKTENLSFSMPETHCRVPRNTNFSFSFRTSRLAARTNSSVNHSRCGFTLTKAGKSMNESTTDLFLSEILNFPSGMNETNHRLIGLRKLII